MSAAAKKTPAAVKKTAAKKPAKKAVPTPNLGEAVQAQIEEDHENRVFLDLIKRYTHHQDWEMVEDLFDIYGRILSDREQGR